MEPWRNAGLLPAFSHSHHHFLPCPHFPPFPPPSPPHQTPPPQTYHRLPQPQPPPPLPRHGRRFLGHHLFLRALPLLDHLLPAQNPANRASLLLGVHFLPLQNLRVRGHVPYHPQREFPAADIPPRLPPHHGAGHVLHLAPHIAVSVPGGDRSKCDGSRGDVYLLLVGCARGEAKVEEKGDRVSDISVHVKLYWVGLDAHLPFQWFWLLWDLGLVLQHFFLCFPFGFVHGLPSEELWKLQERVVIMMMKMWISESTVDYDHYF
ncbi:hypothetical protein FF1_044366 [Malus domestica]|uniref:Uncharacterized protein n=1 Tax=Malus baccata TaxID=106549 RepID=A0A540MMC5_MALBA|nr:hypothetical protein C1H46_014469 [Malus baccata]